MFKQLQNVWPPWWRRVLAGKISVLLMLLCRPVQLTGCLALCLLPLYDSFFFNCEGKQLNKISQSMHILFQRQERARDPTWSSDLIVVYEMDKDTIGHQVLAITDEKKMGLVSKTRVAALAQAWMLSLVSPRVWMLLSTLGYLYRNKAYGLFARNPQSHKQLTINWLECFHCS